MSRIPQLQNKISIYKKKKKINDSKKNGTGQKMFINRHLGFDGLRKTNIQSVHI